MSMIEKLSILGVRSFGPDDQNKQVIEFFKPLTLILGPNGSGKTTIIECLRYMATGDMPPNSDRGASFVHDPKIAGETEVKGQVKLQFKDVLDQKVIVTRNLVATQKQKKVQLKTLEGAITRRGASGEKSSLSSKCAEIDKEMVTALGVSKAILNNVIFCHQEESNWALSEGKALKLKFDEIFASMRYIKACEEIRKIRIKKVNDIRVYKTEVEALKENKRKAEEFSSNLQKTETRLSACRDSISGIDEKLKPVTERLGELAVQEHEMGKVQADFESNKKLLKKIEKDEEELRNTIGDVFSGTKEELKTEMENFHANIRQKQRQMEKVRNQISVCEREYDKASKNKSRLLEELGKLKVENRQHEERVHSRDLKLAEMNKELGLGDIVVEEDEPLSEHQVKSIMSRWKQKITMSQEQLRQTKEKYDSDENAVQSKLDQTRDKLSRKTQEQKSSMDKISKNKETISNIEMELGQASSLASRQEDIKEDLKEAEKELEELQKSIDINTIKTKISDSQQQKKEIELKISQLNREMSQLQKENKLRTEIDLTSKEKTSKLDALNRLIQKHKDTVVHLLGRMPERNVQDSMKAFVNSLAQEIHNLTRTVNEKRSKVSSLKTSRTFHDEELCRKEEQLTSYKNKLFAACGSENFDESFSSLQKTIKELQDEAGAFSGSLYLYNKYIEKLNTRKPCCPLCTREFQNQREAESLKQELQKKLQLVPSQLSKKEKAIEEHQKRLNKMLELKPLKEDIAKMSEVEIPELRKKVSDVRANIERITSEISELEETLESKQCDLKTGSDMLPDFAVLDQNQRDMERLERRLSTLTCQLGSGDITRTVQKVSEEIEEHQAKVESLKNLIERNQQRINEFNEQVQNLHRQINALMSEKVEIAGRLQKKTSLEEQVNALTAENAQLNEFLKNVKGELASLEKSVSSLNAEKQDLLRQKDRELEKMRNQIKMEEREMESLNTMNLAIDKYVREKRGEKLAVHESNINDISASMSRKSSEISNLKTEEKELEKSITSQQLKYREYEDNVKLFDMQEEMSLLKAQCRKLESQIGNFQIRTFLSEKRRLSEEEKHLNKERSELEGRQTELKNQVMHLKQQLQDRMYKDAEQKHRDKVIELRTTELACEDLNKYYIALDRAIMKYHQMKMSEINKIIRDLWIKTYAGNDIDYIEIRSNEDETESGIEKRRTYNYRVVLVKGDTAVDMRGRCSAGQKVLACLIIRLALAEVFCLNCGILALDEPTTNLDRDNICSLAHALIEIVQSRSEQRNFQLIIITHDEDFIELLGRSEAVEYFYRVSKDVNGCSKLSKCRISDMA